MDMHVSAQLLSDQTGLVNKFNIETGGHVFEIKTVANFDVINHEFDHDKKSLIIFINSQLENNLGEMIIPKNLLGGDLTFYLNDIKYFPQVNHNEKISFITFNFTGSGNNKIEVFGTSYLDQLIRENDTFNNDNKTKSTDNSILKYDTQTKNDLSLDWWHVLLISSIIIIIIIVIIYWKKKNGQ